MEARVNKFVLLVISSIIVFSSCHDGADHENTKIVVQVIKRNNFNLYTSNKRLCDFYKKDSISNIKVNELRDLNKSIREYFEELRAHFIFQIENGNKKFFVADTLNYSNIKNYDNADQIFEYLTSNKIKIKNEIEKMDLEVSNIIGALSKDGRFDIASIEGKRNNAYDFLQAILIIENYYLIKLNSELIKITSF